MFTANRLLVAARRGRGVAARRGQGIAAQGRGVAARSGSVAVRTTTAWLQQSKKITNLWCLHKGTALYHKAHRRHWEITAPQPEGQCKLCGLRQPSGGIMQPSGGIRFPEGLHDFHWPEGRAQ